MCSVLRKSSPLPQSPSVDIQSPSVSKRVSDVRFYSLWRPSDFTSKAIGRFFPSSLRAAGRIRHLIGPADAGRGGGESHPCCWPRLIPGILWPRKLVACASATATGRHEQRCDLGRQRGWGVAAGGQRGRCQRGRAALSATGFVGVAASGRRDRRCRGGRRCRRVAWRRCRRVASPALPRAGAVVGGGRRGRRRRRAPLSAPRRAAVVEGGRRCRRAASRAASSACAVVGLGWPDFLATWAVTPPAPTTVDRAALPTPLWTAADAAAAAAAAVADVAAAAAGATAAAAAEDSAAVNRAWEVTYLPREVNPASATEARLATALRPRTALLPVWPVVTGADGASTALTVLTDLRTLPGARRSAAARLGRLARACHPTVWGAPTRPPAAVTDGDLILAAVVVLPELVAALTLLETTPVARSGRHCSVFAAVYAAGLASLGSFFFCGRLRGGPRVSRLCVGARRAGAGAGRVDAPLPLLRAHRGAAAGRRRGGQRHGRRPVGHGGRARDDAAARRGGRAPVVAVVGHRRRPHRRVRGADDAPADGGCVAVLAVAGGGPRAPRAPRAPGGGGTRRVGEEWPVGGGLGGEEETPGRLDRRRPRSKGAGAVDGRRWRGGGRHVGPGGGGRRRRARLGGCRPRQPRRRRLAGARMISLGWAPLSAGGVAGAAVGVRCCRHRCGAAPLSVGGVAGAAAAGRRCRGAALSAGDVAGAAAGGRRGPPAVPLSAEDAAAGGRRCRGALLSAGGSAVGGSAIGAAAGRWRVRLVGRGDFGAWRH